MPRRCPVTLALQYAKMYSIYRRGTRWYLRMLYFALEMGATNARVIYNFHRRNAGLQAQDALTFRHRLVDELVGPWMAARDRSAAPGAATGPIDPTVDAQRRASAAAAGVALLRRRGEAGLSLHRLSAGRHFPVAGRAKRRCVLCATASGVDKRTTTYCFACNVGLCCKPAAQCFFRWHDPDLFEPGQRAAALAVAVTPAVDTDPTPAALAAVAAPTPDPVTPDHRRPRTRQQSLSV